MNRKATNIAKIVAQQLLAVIDVFAINIEIKLNLCFHKLYYRYGISVSKRSINSYYVAWTEVKAMKCLTM